MRHISESTQPIRRALISVSDKTGLVELALQFVKRKIEIIATGGTGELLTQHEIPFIEVSEYVGFPEIMGGRVKTLHPKIYGGLLARQGVDDQILIQYAIKTIDVLVVNLYPFEQTIASPSCTLEKAVEQIDVGGPSMLRAGAKNFAAVTVLVDPKDYSRILKEMDDNRGSTRMITRKQLAQKTFEYLSYYDATISTYFKETESQPSLPSQIPFTFHKKSNLRYGENPHQAASLYSTIPPLSHSLTEAKQIQGKPLSFNNLLDADCAYRCVYEGDKKLATCVIVKHATPCGAAYAPTQSMAYQKAYTTDPSSAFGGIIAFNTPLEKETVEKILSQNHFVEVIIAPDFFEDALALLKKKNLLRLLIAKPWEKSKANYAFYSITGGLLAQEADILFSDPKTFTVASQRHPTQEEEQDLYFAWQIVKYVKSNAIVYVKNGATCGIGSGQTSRVFSVQIAAIKADQAGLSLENAVMASDAFFPFRDSIDIAKEAGIRAIIQPGGSIRDKEVIEAVDKAGMAMLLTHQRHFRH